MPAGWCLPSRGCHSAKVTSKPAASLHRRAIEKAPPARAGLSLRRWSLPVRRKPTKKRRAAKLVLC